MLDPAASLAIDFLPVVAEEAHDRTSPTVEDVLLKGVHEAGVGVLILVDKQDGIVRGHHGPKFGPAEKRNHAREHILLSQGHLRIGNHRIRSEEHRSGKEWVSQIKFSWT